MPGGLKQPHTTDRVVALAYAHRHGFPAAAQRYAIPSGTLRSWSSRAKAQAAKAAAAREAAGQAEPAPAHAAHEDAVRRILAWALTGSCLRCGGAGQVRLEAVRRGSLVIRRPQVIACPDCGAPLRRVRVVEHDRDTWREAMARAGDLGLGWNAREWGLIRSGELDPDGRRITGRPDAP